MMDLFSTMSNKPTENKTRRNRRKKIVYFELNPAKYCTYS